MQAANLSNPSSYSRLLTCIRVKSTVSLIFLVFTSFFMMGCVTINDPEASQEYNDDAVGTLDSESVIGQSLYSRRPNLNGITIWITPLPDPENLQPSSLQNSIKFMLFTSWDDPKPLYATSILVAKSGKNLPIYIHIPKQNNPSNTEFFIRLTTNSGDIQINGRNENAYPYGQAYLDGHPINADVAFRLTYDYNFAELLRDFWHAMTYAWLIFPLWAVLWLPGWLFLEVTGLRERFDFGEQMALSIGISLSLIPIIMLWTTILKIKWTGNAVLVAAIILVIIFIGRVIYLIKNQPKIHQNKDTRSDQQQPANNTSKIYVATSFILSLIFIVTFAIRLIMVRDLATPAWVDSVHHALITRLIISLGSYPPNYAPYWDMQPAAYHPGFHSVAATFTWLSKLSIDQSLLILGQVLNACAIFSVYLFTKVLTRSQSSGLFAAIITGFLSPMPAYYTSWGRFTELAGLLILPVAFALILLLLNGHETRRKFLVAFLCALTLGGLFLIHYRVSVFLGCLMAAYFVILILSREIDSSKKANWKLVLFSVFMAIFLIFPWMLQTIKTSVLPTFASASNSKASFFQDFSWAFLTAALGKYILVVAGVGLIWGLIKRRLFSYLLILWSIMLFLMANLDALHLPGGGLISNLSVEIMLFVPISILGGYFIDQIILNWAYLIPKKLIILLMGILIVLSLLVAYSGSKQLITIINPITILSRKADIPAIDWIDKNIPESETIVINPFLWGYGVYAGSDGGYWISPLTGRTTLPPPVLYGLGRDRKKIVEKIQEIEQTSLSPVSFWEFLTANNIHYVYIGSKAGLFSPEKLSKSDLFANVYNKDGVWIFYAIP